MAKAKSSKSSSSPAREPPERRVEAADTEPKPRLPFPVVGIGASAGGLEAFTEFFKAMPPDAGMAFVVIQHLPPERESMLAEIVGRQTSMPVVEVTDGLRVERNRVYIIRPGRTLTIRYGTLHLGEPVEERGHRRPVDDFFRSLAEEQRERSVIIVMSGMGSNGTSGAQAIKAVGGLCIAQEPESAKFPSMPRALFDAGFADFVLRPTEIPDVLIRFASHPYATGKLVPGEQAAREAQALNEIISLLRQRLRHDFTGYKKPTLVRRIQRRMGLVQLTSMVDYARLLRQNAPELLALSDDLMIHVTGFFRDPEAWDVLRQRVIAPLVAARDEGTPIRAWVAACSSGEEAYTLAMLIVEAAEAVGKTFEIKIFATDTAERSLGHARAGVYPAGIESEIAAPRLDRFFDKDDGSYQIKKEVRELVVFAPQNILQDPPFSRLDICTCRNLLIYLEPDVQRRALSLMHFGLREGGALLLGNSETVTTVEDLFEPLDKKNRLYRRVGPTRHGEIEFPDVHPSAQDERREVQRLVPRATVGQLATRALLERHSPPGVVIDRDQHIVYFHGHTERFLDQPRGEPTREILALARDPVRGALRTALQRAFAENQPAVVRDGSVDVPEGRLRIEVCVAPLEAVANSPFFLVTFQERLEIPAPIPPVALHGESRQQLEAELERVRDELRSTIQELQASNEELRASNEESTSINEELQSTNEELETSKEELQSLNEELTTVNAQLQAKMEELEATSNDLSSLLSSTDIAVVFLDRQFRIRRFTPAMNDLLFLIPTDIGRPLSDLARKFKDDRLLDDARTVLQKLVPLEQEILSDSGRVYARRVLPYRTNDNRIDGVVITFVDITERKHSAAALKDSERRQGLILENIADYAIFMVDPDGRIASWNHGAQRVLGYTQAEAIGQPLSLIFTPEDRQAGLPERELLQARERGNASQDGWRVRKDGTRLWGNGILTLLSDPSGRPHGFVKVLQDRTDRRLGEEALKQAKLAAEASSEAKDQFLATVSHELRTPLSAIVLWTSLIEEEKITDPKQLADALRAIKSSAEEQRKLIEDLVDTARIVAGKFRLEFAETRLADVVIAAVEALRPLATQKSVELVKEIEPGIGTVQADASRLQQVLNNLLHNAIKFTPPNGRVSATLRRDGDDIQLIVADNGAGISKEFREKIFERFTQAESGRADGGLGLGLSIVRQIVEMHGGSVSVESPGENKGTTFTVRLRLPNISESGVTSSREGDTPLKPLLAGRSVLIVEDVAATRNALIVVVQRAGAVATGADSAVAAWDAIERNRPDVILSDLGLPGIDGCSFIRRLRETETELQLAPTPALALTAFGGSGISDTALECGFQLCLTKPIDPLRLVTALAGLLKK